MSWTTIASGDSTSIPDVGNDAGTYRITIDLPISIPSAVAGALQSTIQTGLSPFVAVESVTVSGSSTVAVYTR